MSVNETKGFSILKQNSDLVESNGDIILDAKGIDEVVRPRGVTYSGTCHQWLTMGASFNLIFPIICDHLWRVVQVSCQASQGRLGQTSPEE